MNIIEAITVYSDAQDWISQRIKKCLTKPADLAVLIGIKKSQFYDRLRKGNWRAEEMQKLSILLDSHKQITIGGPEGV